MDFTSFNSGTGSPLGSGDFSLGPQTPAPPLIKAEKKPKQRPRSIAEELLAEPCSFDFFQAVKLLEQMYPDRRPVGREGTPHAELVRFRARQSLEFPASSIYDLTLPADQSLLPEMEVQFLGLTGPSGALPRHYSELLIRLQFHGKGKEKFALRDWLDQFNHRLISLFFRAWEKYRFVVPYARGEYANRTPDTFTAAAFSLIGQGFSTQRNRLQISAAGSDDPTGEKPLARVQDLSLLHYAGLFAQRPRTASNLQALLQDYFSLPVEVDQFQGQWLRVESESQSRLGGEDTFSRLGMDLVAGERVWDVQSKIRIRLGPLSYEQFLAFLPDRQPTPERKSFFLLSHLVQLFIGPDLDFEIQPVLRADEVPLLRLESDAARGPRLGWNSWLHSEATDRDADEVVIEGEALRRLGDVTL